MAVTRSTAAERRQRTPASSALPGAAPAPRTREAILLAGGLAAVLLGLVLVYLAMTRSVADVGPKLASGEVLSLNGLTQAEQLLPHLGFFREPAERSFAADRIWKYLHDNPAGNVGELSRIRVPVSEIEGNRGLTTLRERLETAKSRAGEGEAPETISLLTLSQVRRMKPGLVVRAPGTFRARFWLWAGLLLLAFAAIHAVWRVRRFSGDELILPILLVLSGIGFLLMVAVRDPLRDLPLFQTFAQGAIAGCVLLLGASLFDFERSPLRRMTFVPLLAALGLSVLLIAFGSGPGGSDVKVNLFGFQPVEVVKILVVFFLAGYFFDRWEFLRELPEKRLGLPAGLARWVQVPKLEYVITPILAIGVVLLFFFFQKDLGPALILSFLFLVLYAVARGKGGMLALGAALVALAFFVGYKTGYPQTVTSRISMWLSPWDNAFRGGDHLAQSLWALSAGSLTGTGLGLGQPQLVPEIHTDMVLAAVGEELGFLGILAVLSLYGILVWRGFRTALRAGGRYSFFLAIGLTLLIGLQILLIAGGVVGLVPLSGVVSPFLSSGRTAMLANLLIFGMLLAISARPGDPAALRPFRKPVRWVSVSILAILGLIALRAAQIQVLQANDFLTRGALVLQGDGYRRFDYNPRLEEIARTIPRGSVLDRNGLPLASSDPVELGKHRAAYSRLGTSLEPEAIAEAREDRVYPLGGVTFHLLGDRRSYFNWAASNTSYTERDDRIRLQGYDDYAEAVEVRQPDGTVTREIRYDYSELIPVLRHRWQPDDPAAKSILTRDRTLKMTIDARLQSKTAEILERYAQQAGHGAAAVVMDAATGELLASVSYPWPERLPIRISEDDDKAESRVIDRARYGIYPPGSTFKIVTATAALKKDPDLAEKTWVCKPLPDGRVGNTVRGWGRPIRDDPTDTVPHGDVALAEGIRVSCNAYFAQLGTFGVGAEDLLETAEAFGISVARPNTVEALKDALPQASYGQGQVVATPFQMARVAATVANGGSIPEGRWVLGESNTRTGEPVRILSGAPVALLARSMRQVVTDGTARRFLSGVTPAIAGKTGTAEVQDKRSHSWFIGFTPYGTPGRKLAFAVVIEHGGYGGRLAAPAAGEIVREAAALGLIR
jgi:cell division protein FtsW (lipid II flippase)